MVKFRTLIPWLIAGVAVIAAIAVLFTNSQQASANTTLSNAATVTTITQAETVEASGYLRAQDYAALTWKTGGTVAAVNVKVGDHVQAGEVLLTLQTSSVAANLITAQADLITAQKQLAALQNPTGQARAAAQHSLTAAYAAWDEARTAVSTALSETQTTGKANRYEDVTGAESDLTSTLNAFALTANPDTQWYYWAARRQAQNRAGDYAFAALAADLRAGLDADDANRVDDIVDAQKNYEQALADFAASVTTYTATAKVNAAVSAYQQIAETLLTTSQTAYETLVTPLPAEVAAAQAKVDAAQANLNLLAIIAPFDGEVLAIAQRPGASVSANTSALQLADRTTLYVDAQVDEADIAAVAVGNPAEITLDILPGQTLNGSVTEINPVSELVSGLVKYTVRVELAPLTDPVLLGATADVTLQVSAPAAALAVPAAAVQSDASGEYVSVLAADGTTRRVAVQSGASVGDLVIIVGEVKAGDQVLSNYQNGVTPPSPLSR